MAQSDRNIDRDLRAMRRDQLREEEDKATAERRFREMEDARWRDEEFRRQMEAEEQRKILEEEDRRLAEEERQMRYFEEQRRKPTRGTSVTKTAVNGAKKRHSIKRIWLWYHKYRIVSARLKW